MDRVRRLDNDSPQPCRRLVAPGRRASPKAMSTRLADRTAGVPMRFSS
ncbi:hypothetical protein L842_6194 [Mycobacterium intracellulare MIN_052511_1280]|nr:hypothetical protein L842_6194 [Mycobacterium intracellulare MIN_052511_1280]